MSLYSEYIFERLGDQIIETKNSFGTYRYLPNNTVYIIDIFVIKEFRKTGLGVKIMDDISNKVKSEGYKEILGTIIPSVNGSSESLKFLLKYGMSLKSASNDLIILKKELV